MVRCIKDQKSCNPYRLDSVCSLSVCYGHDIRCGTTRWSFWWMMDRMMWWILYFHEQLFSSWSVVGALCFQGLQYQIRQSFKLIVLQRSIIVCALKHYVFIVMLCTRFRWKIYMYSSSSNEIHDFSLCVLKRTFYTREWLRKFTFKGWFMSKACRLHCHAMHLIIKGA